MIGHMLIAHNRYLVTCFSYITGHMLIAHKRYFGSSYIVTCSLLIIDNLIGHMLLIVYSRSHPPCSLFIIDTWSHAPHIIIGYMLIAHNR